MNKKGRLLQKAPFFVCSTNTLGNESNRNRLIPIPNQSAIFVDSVSTYLSVLLRRLLPRRLDIIFDLKPELNLGIAQETGRIFRRGRVDMKTGAPFETSHLGEARD